MLSLDQETKWKEELKHHTEAEISQTVDKGLSLKQWVILLDVDDALAMSNKYRGVDDGGYHYHQPLVAALKQAGLTEVYLFTTYLLRDVSKTLQRETVSIASRLKLKRYLESEGFVVKGILTPLDPIYNRGIGAYYQEAISPFEDRVLKGENLLEGEGQKLYEAAYAQEVQYLEKVHQDKSNPADKARLFAYTKARLQLSHLDLTFLYFDDRSECLRQIEQVNAQKPAQKSPLLTYCVKPDNTLADYTYILKTFVDYHHVWQTLKAQLEPAQIAGRPQILARLKNALFEIMPCSRIPLFFYGKLEAIQLQFETLIKNPYLIPIPVHPLSQETLEQTIRKLVSPEPTGYQLWGYGESPLPLSQETALKLLSEEQGKRVRHNFAGDGYVSCIENSDGEKLFFKIPYKNILQPLIETFVFELSQCLGGGLISPSRLLIIEKPNQEFVLVQASLGVGDIDLDKLLLIPTGLQGLAELMGKEALLKVLPHFISEAYFKDWLVKQDPKPDLSFEGQKAYFIQALKKREQWPEELSRLYQHQQALKTTKGNEDLAYQEVLGKGQNPWLKVLALMEDPNFSKEDSLDNLLCLVRLFEAIRQVYPKASAEVILNHAPKLLNCISRRNYSQHFLLSLLTSPGDSRGDNFRVSLTRDEQGLPMELQLISIDNDIAFMQGIAKGKPSVKTVIYALSHLLKETIEISVLKLLSQTTADTVLLQVFSKLVSVKNYYEQLFKRVYGEEFEEAEKLLSFDDFFRKGFSGKWLKVLAEIFKPLGSHLEILSQQEPGLSCYMQALAKECDFNPQKILAALFNQHEKEVNKNYDISTLLPPKEVLLLRPAQFKGPELNLSQFLTASVQHACKQTNSVTAVEILMQQDDMAVFPLRLSIEVFVALFVRHGQPFIDWLKRFNLETEVSLVYGSNPKDLFSVRDPYLLHNVLSLKNPWLIKGILALGFGVEAEGPVSKYTPLQYAARHNFPEAIFPLIEAGANTTLLHEQRSALTLALEKHFEENGRKAGQYGRTIKTLLAGGVPYKDKQLSLGLNCVHFYQKTEPLVSEALLLGSPDLAWIFSLEQITQAEKPEIHPIRLLGLKETRYLKFSVYQQIFSQGEFSKDNIYGRHNVTAVKVPLTPYYIPGIHFKENPEFAAREIMVHELGQGLFGPITPPVALFKFTKKQTFLWIDRGEIGYPVLATATVPSGLTLQDVLDEPGELAKIELISFAQSLFLTLLINPEDGRADNYMLQPIYQQSGYQYKLVPIDNDRAFVRPLVLNPDGSSVPGPKGLNVKTILYCLDQMAEPLSPQVIEAFLQLEPFEVLERWLKVLALRQENIDKLFSKEEQEAFKKAEPKIDLQMVFKPSVVADIYEKFKGMQHALRENPYCSGLALLCRVIPALGYRYREAFQNAKTAKERFEALTPGCFEISPIKKTVILPSGRVQTKTIISKTTSTRNKDLEVTGSMLEKKSFIEALWTKEEESHPTVALARLGKVHQDASQLEKIQQEVYQGEFKRFLELETSYQQAIINGEGVLKPFDFSLMKKTDEKTGIERQEQLLSLLSNLSFTVLRIYRCEALRESSLRTLLQGLRETLSALELNTCGNLSVSVLLAINLSCPQLEKLGLVGLTFSGEIAFENNPFKALRVLRLERCLGVIEWYLNTPILERLSLVQLNVRKLCTQSRNLHTIELRSCKLFPENALYELRAFFSKLKLKKVKLVDCPLIINAFYYEQYPIFLSLFLKEVDKVVLNKVFTGLHKALQERCLAAEKLNQTEAFVQTVPLISGPLLKAGLQVQAFLDSALESSHKQERLFVAKLLVSSEFRFLSALSQEARVRRVFNILLALAQDKTLPTKEVLALLREIAPQEFFQLSEGERQALWKLLLKALKDKDRDVRAAAFKALGQVISQIFSPSLEGERQVLWKGLLEALKDEYWQVREAAFNALGQVFSQGFSQLSEGERQALWKGLLEVLKDKDYQIREAACKALGEALCQDFLQLAKGERQALWKLLLEALKDKDWQVREAAFNALGQVISQVLSQLVDEKRRALWELLLEALKDKDRDVRAAAFKALGQVISQSFMQLSEGEREALWKVLLEALKDEYWRVREAAFNALGQVFSQGFSQLPEGEWQALCKGLLEALKDEYSEVRKAAVKALGEALSQSFLQLLEGERQALWKGLLEVLKDKDYQIREAAFNALGQVFSQGFSQLLEEERQALWKVLLEALNKGENLWVRMAASKALEQVISKGFSRFSEGERQVLWKGLLEALKDEYWQVREAAFNALGQVFSQDFSQLSEGERQALWKGLLEALKDKDWQIRKAAFEALEQVIFQVFSQLVDGERRALWKLLLEAVKDKDSEVRKAAVKALGQVISQGFIQLAEGELEAYLKRLLEAVKDEHSWVRGAAVKALGQVISQSFMQLSEGEREAYLKRLLEAVKDKDSEVRKAAVKALGQVFSQGFSQLSEGERQALWKLLLEAVKDEHSWVRGAAFKALGEALSQGFMQLAEEERQACLKRLLEAVKDKDSWVRTEAIKALGQFLQLAEREREALWKRLLGVVKELYFPTVIELGKILASEKFIEYFSCVTLLQKFIQSLETHSEIQKILNQRASTLVEASFSQGYSLYEVEKLLSVFRRKFLVLQEGTELLDFPYHQNPKNCFLANPLMIEDLPKQLFEITNLLLTQETPWYPKRMILPIFEQTHWSVIVLEGDYEKLSFDLLWDSPANSNLNQVLPAVKSSLDRLVQSWHGSFQAYHLQVYHKHFVQQEPAQFVDSGPITVQNIEDYLTYPGEPLSQFIETDKLLTIKQFKPSTYSSTLQAIRLKHRSLMVDSLPDHQLSSRALFFKYTRFPAEIESLVMGYCEETPPGTQRKPSVSLTAPSSSTASSPSSSSNVSSQIALSSHLSDEKVVQELSEILTQLNAENISKESDSLLKGSVPSSLPSTPIISSAPVVPVGGRLLEAERKTFQEGEVLFEKLLAGKNLVATKVSGQGLNCFIYSLLQHVTGRYDLDKFDELLIRRIKQEAGLGSNFTGMIYPDTPQTLNLVKAINKTYKVNLEVHFVQINEEGKPLVLPPLFDDKALGQRQSVMPWLQVNHYVAITSQRLFAKAAELVSGLPYDKSARRLSGFKASGIP